MIAALGELGAWSRVDGCRVDASSAALASAAARTHPKRRCCWWQMKELEAGERAHDGVPISGPFSVPVIR